MPDPLIPGPANVTVDDGPSPSSAGMSWSASAAAWDTAARAFGGAEQLVQAHQDTVDAAARAKMNSDIETTQQGIAEAHQYDSSGAQQALAQARSSYVSSVGGRLAVEAGRQWDLTAATTSRGVQANQFARDHVLAGQSLDARNKLLREQVAGEYGSGAPLDLTAQSPTLQANIDEMARNRAALVTGKFISPEQAQIEAEGDVADFKTSAFSGHLLSMIQKGPTPAAGIEAARQEVERLRMGALAGSPADPNAWEGADQVSARERQMMVARGYSAVRQASTDMMAAQRLQEQAQATDKAAFEVKRTAAINAAFTTGKVDNTLQPSDFSAHGLRYDEYVKEAQAAATDHATNGDASQYPTQQAYLDHRLAVSTMKAADPGEAKNMVDLDAGFRTIVGQEGGVRKGVPLISPQGAMGTSQLTLGTARSVLQRHPDLLPGGQPLGDDQLRAMLLNRDQSFNTRIGQTLWQDLNGDLGSQQLSALAYHGGPGAVRGAIAAAGGNPALAGGPSWADFADAWERRGNPKDAQYLRDFIAGYGVGHQQATIAHVQSEQSPWGPSRKAFEGDPLAWAQNHSMASVTPLPDFRDPSWSKALQQRFVTGQQLAGQYQVTPRVLTDAETKTFADALHRDPTIAVPLAQQARAALGDDGAAALLNEVGVRGGAASMGLQLARLSSMGRDTFVNAAQAGMTNAADKFDTEPALKTRQGWAAVAQPFAPAFRDLAPDRMGAITDLAKAARLGDAHNGSLDSPESYFDAAAGGTHNIQGVRFGGVDRNVNGVPVLLPPWMKQQSMPTALRAIGDDLASRGGGPHFANGQPMRGANLAGMHPVAQPDGSYALINPQTGGYIDDGRGGRFRVDMEAYKARLTSMGMVGLSRAQVASR